MILSIIVISHNQREQLRRCIDSILTMPLSFEYEIIISDDSSTDGTWELAKQYATEHIQIKSFQCDSNDFHPTNDGSRGCWNRCNAYPHATGKYIAFVDGDDFFIHGTDIYSKQVELLEQHPDCSSCMANDYNLQEGQDISQATLRHKEIKESGEILSSEDYIRNHFHESHCCVFRRNPNVDPVKLYGGFFEDTVITNHHIQHGNIVCLNDAGYIYVQYPTSIWAQQIKSNDYIIFAHALYIPILMPKWRIPLLSSPSKLSSICDTIRLAYLGHKLKDENLQWAKHFPSFVYQAFNRTLGPFDKIHLVALWLYIRILIKIKPKATFFYQVLPHIL